MFKQWLGERVAPFTLEPYEGVLPMDRPYL
jgi:hypothetical protein